jgi:hypothetical protein
MPLRMRDRRLAKLFCFQALERPSTRDDATRPHVSPFETLGFGIGVTAAGKDVKKLIEGRFLSRSSVGHVDGLPGQNAMITNIYAPRAVALGSTSSVEASNCQEEYILLDWCHGRMPCWAWRRDVGLTQA